MGDHLRKCRQCLRMVTVLDTAKGPVWEEHTDRSGRWCGNSSRPAK